MNRFLRQRLTAITMALLLLSVTVDLVVYFKSGTALQAAGLWALVGGVVISGAYTVVRVYRATSHRMTTTRRRLVLASVALTGVMILLALWRWSAGPAAVSSFDGGYPVLIAFAFILAVYQSWRGNGN